MRPVLVTAGATRNSLDAIRFISARASGRTGCEIAAALVEQGAKVHLLGHPETLLRAPVGVRGEEYGSTRDLMTRMQRWVKENPAGLVIHSAAVGDYEAEPDASKIPSGQEEIVLRLRPAPKILDHLKRWSERLRVVSFKAAAPGTPLDELEAIARRQLLRTRSDLVFANVLGRLGTEVLLVEEEQAWRFEERDGAVSALVGRLRGWLLEELSAPG